MSKIFFKFEDYFRLKITNYICEGKELNKYYCFRSDPYICIDKMPYIVMFMK